MKAKLMTVEQLAQEIGRQITAELGGLPAQDYRRVVGSLHAGNAGLLFRATLRVARDESDKLLTGHAWISESEAMREMAEDMERLAHRSDGEFATKALARATELRAESDDLAERAGACLDVADNGLQGRCDRG